MANNSLVSGLICALALAASVEVRSAAAQSMGGQSMGTPSMGSQSMGGMGMPGSGRSNRSYWGAGPSANPNTFRGPGVPNYQPAPSVRSGGRMQPAPDAGPDGETGTAAPGDFDNGYDDNPDGGYDGNFDAPGFDGGFNGGYGPGCNGNCGRCARCCPPKSCLCGPPGTFWVRDEYLGFFTKGDDIPVLVTTSSTAALPATVPLFGGNSVNQGYRNGNWIQIGMWLNDCHTCALEGDYFFIGRINTPYSASSNGTPILARPFTDATTGAASQELVADGTSVVGRISAAVSNNFQGAGINCRQNLCCWCDPCQGMDQGCGTCFNGQCCSRLDFTSGFRYYNFNDSLHVTENLTSISNTNGVPVGTFIDVRDSFRTTNNFYGYELGLIADRYRDRWMYEGAAKVALGGSYQTVDIAGTTTNTVPLNGSAVNQGGLLALSSNIGHYHHTNFTAIPLLSGRIGYRFTPRLTLLVGYSFIYWGNVAKAGNQIDTTVNPALLPPAQSTTVLRPAFNLHESPLWAQGVTIGAEYHF